MVFFICEVCNECIKKPKVDQHINVCRNAWVFCCMDCGERFQGPAYKAHTACMTEAERYEGKFYVPKDKKGDKKQQSWTESVLSRLESADSKHAGLKPYMEKLTQYDNLPRKKVKFINFAKNSLNLKADREGIAEKLWALIEDTEKGTKSECAVVIPTTSAAPDPAPIADQSLAAAKISKAKKERKGESSAGEASSAECVVQPPDQPCVHVAEKGLDSRGDADATANGVSQVAKRDKKDTSPGEADEKKSSQKRQRDDVQPPGGAKPVKWKKIVANELTSCGGRMNMKELRKAVIAEVLAHPSHKERNKAELLDEFDRTMPRFKRFQINGNQVTFGPEQT
jgi:cell growth-regulating nucleolar protein